MMKVVSTLFKEVFLFQPNKHVDFRGSFSEVYVQYIFEKNIGRQIHFCQDNYTTSKRGVLRGLHYQIPPHSQAKLVSVFHGRVLDIVVDVRKGSPTFGQHFSQELSAENGLQLFIPRGFAHGFITLSDTSLFGYKVDNYYHPESEGSIAPEDPELAIDWKLPKSDWILSEKDRLHPNFKDATLFEFKDAPYD